ncbi:MAG: aldehyde-activating protein, partial [Gammaproteobacteria bacterium]
MNIYQCHCSLCKKQSGSSSNSATIIHTQQFEWIKGNEYIKTWKKETGFNSHFCEQCGSPVPNKFAGEYIWVPVGLLDIEDDVEVVADLCLSSHSCWHI